MGETAETLEPKAAAACSASFDYQPALDGLRGLAIVAVLLYHGGHLTGGYLGVDAFFVLSGFLITSLLLDEARREGRISLRGFWARRARRLLPALVCVLFAVALYAAFVAKPDELADIRGDAFATLTYVSNWRAIFQHRNYFDLFRSPSPLQHTWSLAIEEQFYLVWPLIVVALTRGRSALASARRVLGASVVLALASFAEAQILYRASDPSRVYYGTDTRIASVLVGAAIAAWLMAQGPLRGAKARRRLEIAAFVCGGGLLVAWATLSGTATGLYRGGLLLSAVATATVILATVHPSRGALARALSWHPLRALGRVSYGAYLWHWPVYVYLDSTRLSLTGWPLLIVQITLTLLLATASHMLIERPAQRRGRATRLMTRASPFVAVVLVVVLVASTSGTPPRTVNSYLQNGVPVRGSAYWNASLALFRREARASRSDQRVLIVGDSTALSMGTHTGGGIDGASLGLIECSIVAGAFVSGGVGRAPDPKCGAWASLYADAVNAFNPDVAVLMLGPWEMFDHESRGQVLRIGSAAMKRALLDSLARAYRVLSAHGAHVVILTTPCFQPTVSPFPGAQAILRDPSRSAFLNSVWRSFASMHPATVSTVDLAARLCSGDRSRTGTDIRYDGVHFTPKGATLVWQWLAPKLAELHRA